MQIFTTGQVARICKVAPRTVSKWFDSGRLKGYRIPAGESGVKGGDRRITRANLVTFMTENGFPHEEMLAEFEAVVTPAVEAAQ